MLVLKYIKIFLIALVVSSVLLFIAACGGGNDDKNLDDEETPPDVTEVSVDIDIQGGKATSADNVVSVTIPTGALTDTQTITITKLASAPSGIVGNVYEFGPEGLQFKLPVKITFAYDPAHLPPGLVESTLNVSTLFNNYFWLEAGESTVNESDNTIEISVSNFSSYGLSINTYTTVLEGSQSVPVSPSTAYGSGLFSIDTQKNMVSYFINYYNLQGNEIAAQIHGPANRGETAAAAVSLTASSNKHGIWIYDESLESDLLAGRMYVNITTNTFPQSEIRGQIEPMPPSSSSSSVTIDVAIWEGMPGMNSVYTTPPNVDSIRYTISGPGMTNIEQTFPVSGNTISNIFSVPKGKTRHFELSAYDASNQVLFRGINYHNVFYNSETVAVTMSLATDNSAPVFSGLDSATKMSGDSIMLAWLAASDNVTPGSAIRYLIYLATQPGSMDYSTVNYVSKPGVSSLTLSGLAVGKTYYFVVRAMDQAGNSDSNLKELSTDTFSSGTGLYVDSSSGTDNADCGVIVGSPCKTITYTLNKSAGNEPLYIAKGNYNNTNGETFPLQLKPGTRLNCDTQTIYVPKFSMSIYAVGAGDYICHKCYQGGYFIHYPKTIISSDFDKSIVYGAESAHINYCGFAHNRIDDLSGIDLNNPPSAIDDKGHTISLTGIWVNGRSDSARLEAHRGIRIDADYSSVSNSRIQGFQMQGIMSFGDYATISGNDVLNSLWAVEAKGDYTTVHGNRFKLDTSFGIPGWSYASVAIRLNAKLPGSGQAGPTNATISENLMIDTASGGISLTEVLSAKLEHNVILNAGGIHIVNIYNQGQAIELLRNIVAQNSATVGINIFGDYSNVELGSNKIIQNFRANLIVHSTLQVDLSGCNTWDNSPPTVYQIPPGEGCPVTTDICYGPTTPEPTYDTGTCAFIPMP